MKITGYLIALLIFIVSAGCDSKGDVASHLQKAQTYLGEKKYNESIIELKNVLQLDPNHQEARYLLGTIYIKVGNGQSAEKELNKALSLGVTQEKVKTP